MDQANNYFSWEKRSSSVCRKLNTKQFCFLCLNESNRENMKVEDAGIDESSSEQEKLTSLRSLQRHLKINIAKVTESVGNFSVPDLLANEVEVSLCQVCEKLTKKFSGLFTELEKVQMEMDYYLEQIHDRVADVGRAPEVLQAYSKEMTSDKETLLQLAFVDKLRKEISTKSLLVRVGLNPRVEMTKVEVEEDRPIPVFIKMELPVDDQNNEGNMNNGRAEEIVPNQLFPEQEPQNSEPSQGSDKEPELPTPEEKRKKLLRSLHQLVKQKKGQQTGEKKYFCEICDKSFYSYQGRRLHINSIHLRKMTYCKYCKKGYVNPSSRLVHERKCLGKDGASLLENVSTFNKNILNPETETVAVPPSSDTANDFRIAKWLSENMNNTRKLAPKENGKKKKRQKRIQGERLRKEFHCPTCGKGFINQHHVRRHQSEVHLNERKFPCEFCNNSFKQREHLKRHKISVHFKNILQN